MRSCINRNRRATLGGRSCVLALGLLAGVVASPAPARAEKNSQGSDGSVVLNVEFTACVESIGVDLVPTEQARALVPAEFILVGDGTPVTPLVVRTAHCGGISVEGRPARAGSVVQIGVVIVPPDGTGDINNYTLWYYTDSLQLAAYLVASGVPAQFVPTLNYDYQSEDANGPGLLQVRVPLPGVPALRLDGLVAASDVLAGSFEANWWSKGRRRTLKMATLVPEIYIGGAELELETRPRSQLGRLIGGETLVFPLLQQFNTFDSAGMQVSVATP